MRFRVTRTSGYAIQTRQERPCREAEDEPGIDTQGYAVTKWYVEIGSLEELIAFIRRHGRIVLTPVEQGPDHIEIYDDYRE